VTSKLLLTVDEVLHFEVEEGAGFQLVQSMQRFFSFKIFSSSEYHKSGREGTNAITKLIKISVRGGEFMA
jgi:hypothetical protein